MFSRMIAPLSRRLAPLSASSRVMAPKILVPVSFSGVARLAPFHTQSRLFAEKGHKHKTIQESLDELHQAIMKKKVEFTEEDLKAAKEDLLPEYSEDEFGPLEEVTIEELPEIARIPAAEAHFALEFVNTIPYSEHLFTEPPMIKELEDEEEVEEKTGGSPH